MFVQVTTKDSRIFLRRSVQQHAAAYGVNRSRGFRVLWRQLQAAVDLTSSRCLYIHIIREEIRHNLVHSRRNVE